MLNAEAKHACTHTQWKLFLYSKVKYFFSKLNEWNSISQWSTEMAPLGTITSCKKNRETQVIFYHGLQTICVRFQWALSRVGISLGLSHWQEEGVAPTYQHFCGGDDASVFKGLIRLESLECDVIYLLNSESRLTSLGFMCSFLQ